MIGLRSGFFGITFGCLVSLVADLFNAYALQPYQNEKNMAVVDWFFSPITWLFLIMIFLLLRYAFNFVIGYSLFSRAIVGGLAASIIFTIIYTFVIFAAFTVLAAPRRYSMFQGSGIGESIDFQLNRWEQYWIMYLPAIAIGIIVFTYDNVRKS